MFEDWPDYCKVPTNFGGSLVAEMAGRGGNYTSMLMARMGWPARFLRSSGFPLKDVIAGYYPAAGKVLVTYVKDEVRGYVEDDVTEFPSDTLVAALRLLCGRMNGG